MSPEVRTDVNMKPYRQALALPGLRSLLLVAVLARIPLTATGVTLTFHVVLDLDRGYGAAGLVGAASPSARRSAGRCSAGWWTGADCARCWCSPRSPRRVFWSTAPPLPYPVLLPAAFVAGSLALPIFSVVRQSIAALVRPTNAARRTRWTRCRSSCPS